MTEALKLVTSRVARPLSRNEVLEAHQDQLLAWAGARATVAE